MSRTTFAEAADSYVARDIGMVKVKGKDVPVPIVEVVGHSGDGVDPSFYQQFERTVEMLKAGDTELARAQLRKMIAEKPNDEVLSLYLAKLEESSGAPAREMIFEFESK